MLHFGPVLLFAARPQLRIRALWDNVAIQGDGSFVAGYELSGLNSSEKRILSA
jgi:hypothetical protein